MNPLVSIIIPAYNVGPYIEKCIISSLHQTYTNIEIIVVNDGSTDNTYSIIREIAKLDNRIIIINNKNKGVSASRNDGIAASRGEWIVFVDGDDYLAEDFIEHMFLVAKMTGSEFCMSTDCYMNTKDKQTSDIHIEKLAPDMATSLLLSPRVAVGCWNKMFKKELLDKHKIRFSTDLFYGEGLYFITTLSQLSNSIGVSNQKVYYYRQDNYSSATKKFNVEKIINGWEALDRIDKNLNSGFKLSRKKLDQHRYLFSFTAVKKIIDSKSVDINKDIYNFYLTYLRKHLFYYLFDKTLSYKYKIRILACCLTPGILPYYRKIRQK